MFNATDPSWLTEKEERAIVAVLMLDVDNRIITSSLLPSATCHLG
jgi:hypothetical protein